MPTARVAPWSRFEEAALDTRVRRRLFTESRAMVVLSGVTLDSFSPDHTHAVDQIITPVAGRVEVRLNGRHHRLAPGQTTRVPAGTPHSIRRVGDEPAETLNIFSPGN